MQAIRQIPLPGSGQIIDSIPWGYMKTLLTLLFFLFVSTTALAANKPENKLIAFGFVAEKTCSQYIKLSVKTDENDMLTLNGNNYYSDKSLYTQWVAGFLSGFSAGIQKPYPESLNIYYLMLRIEDYCERNPDDYFSHAVNKTILEIK